VGGVFDADDASRLFDAGASLVQLYSGFIYKGPALVKAVAQAAPAGTSTPARAPSSTPASAPVRASTPVRASASASAPNPASGSAPNPASASASGPNPALDPAEAEEGR
jgi:hypothetical protein